MKGIRNPFYRKIFYIALVVILAIMLIIFVGIKLSTGNAHHYIIEDSLLEEGYQDFIIRDYKEYNALAKKYEIPLDLVSEDFTIYDYLVSYQEYDPCKEIGFKKLISIEEENGRIVVTFKVNNKCGWCGNKIVLYLIAIPKDTDDLPIEYVYNYNKQKKCNDVDISK